MPILNADTGRSTGCGRTRTAHATARVAPGSYSVFARIVTPVGDSFTIAGTPALDVHADTQYVIDARKAERVRPPAVAGQETEPRVAVGATYSRRSRARGYTEFGFFDPAIAPAGPLTPTGERTSGASRPRCGGASSRRAASAPAPPTPTSCCSPSLASPTR